MSIKGHHKNTYWRIVNGVTNSKAIAMKMNWLNPNCIVSEYKQLNITAPSNVQTVSTAATAANKAPRKDSTGGYNIVFKIVGSRI